MVDRDDRLARIDCRARRQLEAPNGVEDAQTRTNRALGVVAVRDRRAEHSHDGVADELLDHPAVVLDAVLGFAVVRLQHVADVLRVGLVGAGGRVDEVDEEDRDELAFLLRRVGGSKLGAAAAAEARARRVRLSAARAPNFDDGHSGSVAHSPEGFKPTLMSPGWTHSRT